MTEDPAPADGIAARITRAGAHSIDQWTDPLDDVFTGTPLVAGQPIDWGLLYGVNKGDWTPPDATAVVLGKDWEVRFSPPGIGDPRPNRERTDVHTCVVIARLQARTVQEARDRGRPAVRCAAGLATLLSRYIAGQTPLWEGPIAAGEAPGSVVFGQLSKGITIPTRSIQDIEAEFVPFLGVAVEALPKHVSMALYWYQHAWGRLDLVDRFAAFWWAGLVLVEHGQRRQDTQRERIAKYAQGLVGRFALAPARASDIEMALTDAYDARNDLFHESDPSSITVSLVTRLERVVSDILHWEVTHPKG